RSHLALSGPRNRRRLAGRVAFRPHFDRRAVLAEGDDVAVLEQRLALHRPAVDEGAVRAVVIGDVKRAPSLEDLTVLCRDVEVEVRIEAQIARRLPADENGRLVEDLALTGACSAEDAKL